MRVASSPGVGGAIAGDGSSATGVGGTGLTIGTAIAEALSTEASNAKARTRRASSPAQAPSMNAIRSLRRRSIAAAMVIANTCRQRLI